MKVWAEFVALGVVLVLGAAYRYWLGTVLPYDATELRLLGDAAAFNKGMRVTFVMVNGMSLFLLYATVRRRMGTAWAFAVLLLLQTSPDFQDWALRIRFSAGFVLVVAIGLLVAASFQPKAPSRRPRLGVGLAVLLALKGAWLATSLPGRMDAARSDAADVAALRASLEACGGTTLSIEAARGCAIAWPSTRSLEQQEEARRTRARVSNGAAIVDSSDALAAASASWVVLDPAGAGLLAVDEGLAREIAERVTAPVRPG